MRPYKLEQLSLETFSSQVLNLRARPEPTQLEHLSDVSFLDKLLVFPTNVKLDWKVIASYKHSSLFGLIDSDEGKKFYKIDTRMSGPIDSATRCLFLEEAFWPQSLGGS